MDDSDDERSDEWVESFDSMDSDDESEVVTKAKFPPLKLAQKSKNKKRVAVSAPATESDESSAADSEDQASKESAEDDDDKDSDNETETGGDDDGSHESKLKSNPAWANAMSKVLRSTKSAGKKGIVLSKAKKVAHAKGEKKPKLDFEIVDGADHAETLAAPDDDLDRDDIKDEKANLKKRLMMKESLSKGRVKPSVLDRDRDRTLMKIATKGVVQLFNAVRQQQKTVDKTIKKAGKSERKREKVLETIDKKKFLDVLTGSAKSTPVGEKIKVEEKGDENSTWGVLRDDFMMGTNLKDWDKNEEEVI